MKFGLVGTGHWARVMHGAVLARAPEVELVAVWGRNGGKTADLAEELGGRAYTDFEPFLEQVDAVAFAVPPEIQADLAARAAGAGKHLLLEKPIATSVAAAERLVAAVEAAGVATVVFFTARFSPSNREWFATVEGAGWQGAWARWIASAFADDSPYANSEWRREKGALWDIGPHAIAMLDRLLGPVEAVTADRGLGDLVHLVFHHAGGATSTASLTLGAPIPAINVEVSLWGPAGVASMPSRGSSPEEAFLLAVAELMANAASGTTAHPLDVHFGLSVVHLLADAEAQIAARTRTASSG